MKAQKPHIRNETQYPHVAFLAALPWSALEAWHQRPKEKSAAAPVPLTEEERYRMIEFVARRQAARRRVAPESVLRDRLDAEEEVKPH